MKPAEFRRLVEKHFSNSVNSTDAGLSAFARWLPAGGRTVMRWANDETPIPSSVARVLQMIDHAPASVLEKVSKLEA